MSSDIGTCLVTWEPGSSNMAIKLMLYLLRNILYHLHVYCSRVCQECHRPYWPTDSSIFKQMTNQVLKHILLVMLCEIAHSGSDLHVCMWFTSPEIMLSLSWKLLLDWDINSKILGMVVAWCGLHLLYL